MKAQPEPTPAALSLGDPIPAESMRAIERTLQLHHFKWDTQVGDADILFPQPLLVTQSTWAWLSAKAENAAREIYALEQAIVAEHALLKLIGVPRALKKLLTPAPAANRLRTLRFDFHPTPDGWRLSEVNTDVPGGWGEAHALPTLCKPFQKKAVTAACPLTAWGDAVAAGVAPGHVALLHAPGYLEDQQVALTLSRELARRGFTTHLIQSPAALRWREDRASLRGEPAVPLRLIVRFFQAEWLARSPRRSGWRELFKPQSGTCVANPPACVISESKRLPLSFDAVKVTCSTLRELWFSSSPDPRGLGPSGTSCGCALSIPSTTGVRSGNSCTARTARADEGSETRIDRLTL